MRQFPTMAVLSAVQFQLSAIFVAAVAQSPEPTLEVVARVDGEAIYRVEVDHALAGIARKRPAADLQDDRVFGQMFEQIIRRRLAHRRLEVLGKVVSKYEIERALAEKKAALEKRARSLDDVLAKFGITQAIFRRDLNWELSWAKFQDASLADAELEAFFDSRRRDFDGSEVRARHILLGFPAPILEDADSSQAAKTREAAVLRAKAIRKQVLNGQITFVDAAREFSTAPSCDSGGDLGYFPRHGVMHEAVGAAAFGLEKGEISQPIVSPFGVHLVEVTDDRPGKLKWTDVREELRVAAARELFEQLVAEQQTTSRVERIWNAK